MKNLTLKLPFFQQYGNQDQKRGPAKVHNGLIWNLYGVHYEQSEWETKHDLLFVECRPVDPEMLFRCEAEITYKSGDEKETADNFMINYTTIGNSDMSEEFNTEYSEIRFETEYMAEIVIKSFEIIPKNTFNFKNTVLSDIQLIVNDKTFHCSKQILALHSKKFYEMIYGGDKEVDRLEIEDVNYSDFYRFLEIIYGFDCGRICRCKILNITELAMRFDSKRCLDHCEASYLRFNIWEDRPINVEEEYIDPKFEEAQAHLTNVSNQAGYEPSNCVPLTNEAMTKLNLTTEDTTILIDIDGMPFRIKTERYQFMRQTKLYIECLYKDATQLWKCNVMVKNVTSKWPSCETIVCTPGGKNWATIYWEPEEEVVMGVKAFWNPYGDQNMDFTIPRDKLTDIVILVGDEKYHVSKQILANASSHFYSIFYSDYTDKVKKEVELKDVDPDEFEEFLQHVYYPRRYVKESTLESLLHLSNYYNVQFIRQNCIRWILFDMEANIAKKMVLAVKHNLDDLFKSLAARIETTDDFTAFSKLDGFDELDVKTIASIKQKEKTPLKRKMSDDRCTGCNRKKPDL